MKFAVVQFPGSNCDSDALLAFRNLLGLEAELLWHKTTELGKVDAVILPGGFSYGDYLRGGAIACFSPVMRSVLRFAKSGGPILGICNGFQMLCECGLLPGALVRNAGMQFRCELSDLMVEDSLPKHFDKASVGEALQLPIAHGEGNYKIDAEGLKKLEAEQCILLRYMENPNGSIGAIAGIRNAQGNVWGMMPHPERAAEGFGGMRDGLKVLKAFVKGVA